MASTRWRCPRTWPPATSAGSRGLRGWRNLAGLSATMPHKEALAAHVDELAGPAALIGAVNVVRREADGKQVLAGLSAGVRGLYPQVA